MRAAPLIITVLLASNCGVAAQAARPQPTRPAQRLVSILASQSVRATPAQDARAVGQVVPRTPITGGATVLPVLGSRRGWLRVALPGRPNGHTGWIRSSSTRLSATRWRLAVDISLRRVTVFELGRAVRTFSGIVGKPSTPTPTGAFFVEEAVRVGASGVGGPYALALSARSNVLQEFDGGPGQIAIHGRDNIGGTLGTAASHGCVRLSDGAMRWLVGRVGSGTPVTITA